MGAIHASTVCLGIATVSTDSPMMTDAITMYFIQGRSAPYFLHAAVGSNNVKMHSGIPMFMTVGGMIKMPMMFKSQLAAATAAITRRHFAT